MQALFLGPAEKLTNPNNLDTGHLQDYQIRLEGISSFPRMVTIRAVDDQRTAGWWYEWPHGRCWSAVVVPTDDPAKVLINFPVPEEAKGIWGAFSSEDCAPLELIIKFADGDPVVIRTQDSRKTLSAIEEIEYLESKLSDWPEAVASAMICDDTSEQDKTERAIAIIEEFVGDSNLLTHLKVLDFGCGEGHVAKKMAESGAQISMGYDIVTPGVPSEGAYVATTSWEDVLKQAPYDLILLYDVIDHVIDVQDVLLKIKSVVKFNTIVIMRCHPWCSRHGGHLYKQLNKAYSHMVFTSEELASMQCVVDNGIKIAHPSKEYKSLFEQAGLKILQQDVITEEMDKVLFNDPIIRKRLKASNVEKSEAEISFIDFRLGVVS